MWQPELYLRSSLSAAGSLMVLGGTILGLVGRVRNQSIFLSPLGSQSIYGMSEPLRAELSFDLLIPSLSRSSISNGSDLIVVGHQSAMVLIS